MLQKCRTDGDHKLMDAANLKGYFDDKDPGEADPG